MKFHIHTLGCKANQWDSYIMEGRLRGSGHVPASVAGADLIIINSCVVTEGATRDLRRFIHRVKRLNQGARILLTGCHAQTVPDDSFGADLVIGQAEKTVIEDYIEGRGVFVGNGRSFPLEKGVIGGLPSGRTRFFLKIQDGCDKFCTYCIVPYGRGAPRSRRTGEIVGIMETLADKGVKEVVLTGIEIASYRDPDDGTDLAGLLQMLEEEITPPRIRISSIDPLYITDRFIDLVARSRKVTASLHIPLQSGSDRILERMGRRYRAGLAQEIVNKLRTEIPDAGIGLDIIAGFPGEDESAFRETFDLLESLDVYYLHVFPFSPRPGTLAASMDGAVADDVRKKRVRILKTLDGEKRRTFFQRFIGKDVSIIAESKIYQGGFIRGYAENYVPVYIPYEKSLENRLLEVRIRELLEGRLLGRVMADR